MKLWQRERGSALRVAGNEFVGRVEMFLLSGRFFIGGSIFQSFLKPSKLGVTWCYSGINKLFHVGGV